MPELERRMAGLGCGDARQVAREALAGVGVGQRALDDALTVVTELVTNAIRHAGGVTGFRIRSLPGAVAIEVSDAYPLMPCSPGTPASVPGGFGWVLVRRLTSRTDIRSRHDGKTITAYLPLTTSAT
ncbi:ATP-binding protein [Streptomyces sp. NBC_01264]|uniref:ATP-binding protein n=1 Tax=Streptomyces sp. NBC_01264 TaxID=2903804 RepID=UPI0022564BAE|nr:ATP-binding protein [Streptomyces sp. NBC_01264]MCX4776068.1 ATP-binding protein [Streptomyces sp. NBC_01264]